MSAGSNPPSYSEHHRLPSFQTATRPRPESRLAGALLFHLVDVINRAGLLHETVGDLQEAWEDTGILVCMCIDVFAALVRLVLIAAGAVVAFKLWRAPAPRDVPARTMDALVVLGLLAILSIGPSVYYIGLITRFGKEEEEDYLGGPMDQDKEEDHGGPLISSLLLIACAEYLRRRLGALRQLPLTGEAGDWPRAFTLPPGMSYASVRDAPGRTCSEECAICLADYSDEDMVCTLPCGHVYHLGCLQQWAATDHRGGVCVMRCTWPEDATTVERQDATTTEVGQDTTTTVEGQDATTVEGRGATTAEGQGAAAEQEPGVLAAGEVISV